MNVRGTDERVEVVAVEVDGAGVIDDIALRARDREAEPSLGGNRGRRAATGRGSVIAPSSRDSGSQLRSASPISCDVEPVSATGVDFVPIPGATVTFEPTSADEPWLVLLSAELSSESQEGEAFSVEARYLIRGVERSFGGVTNVGADSFGSWQHFVVVRGEAAPQTVTVKLRDSIGMTATARQLRVTAFPFDAETEIHYDSVDPIVSVDSRTPEANSTLNFTPAAAGDYLIFVLSNASERLLLPSGSAETDWLLPDGSALANAVNLRKAWQSTFALRALHNDEFGSNFGTRSTSRSRIRPRTSPTTSTESGSSTSAIHPVWSSAATSIRSNWRPLR